MLHPVIRTTGLSKTYGGVHALRDAHIDVPKASVFGFLGPNGSGKTTTIRLLLGLQRPTSGRVTVLDHPAGDAKSLRRLGALVEGPSLYPNLTGLENLRVTAFYRGCDAQTCRHALETVGLRDAAHQQVRGFSLGMKQRLALATALLHEPELLILDEPTNGLDPAGILEMRTLVRDLNLQQGVTIFVSSHLLAEIEQIASHLAVLYRGTVKFSGTLESLRQRTTARLVIGVGEADAALNLLRSHGLTAAVDPSGRLIVTPSDRLPPAAINRLLVDAGIPVHHLVLDRPSLEDQFLDLTRDSQ